MKKTKNNLNSNGLFNSEVPLEDDINIKIERNLKKNRIEIIGNFKRRTKNKSSIKKWDKFKNYFLGKI